jgi:hypothetical protein
MPTFEQIPKIPDGTEFGWFSFLSKMKIAVEKLITYFAAADDEWTYPQFLNGWENYANSYQSASYRKGPDNRVYLSGLIKGGTTGGTTPAFILPVGYRPTARHIFPTIGNSPTLGRIDVSEHGEIFIYYASTSWVTLDGISFEATH